MDAGAPTPADVSWLERARLLARGGWGRVHPNPMVGCVVVHGEEVVGEGYHAELGGPHAEVVALEVAGARAEGATVYVSLEPCDHHGRTPPCTGALLAARVGRVVFGAADPGERSGGGAERLRAAGVEVAGPVWDGTTAWAENPAFVHWARRGTPFVALKLAVSLDGKLAERAGRRTELTGSEARDRVHHLRTDFDALMVGAETARVDDPLLTVRHAAPGRAPPRRLVLDPAGRLPDGARLFRDAPAVPVEIFTRDDVAVADVERLERSGARVHRIPSGPGGLDLGAVLEVCREEDVRSVLCEGGGRLGASLLEEERVGRIYLLLAPRTLGPEGVPAFPGGRLDVWDGFRPLLPPETLGSDTLITLDRAPRDARSDA